MMHFIEPKKAEEKHIIIVNTGVYTIHRDAQHMTGIVQGAEN